ncbi:hypothetical protein ACJX0J_012830, partial [Zea mays]
NIAHHILPTVSCFGLTSMLPLYGIIMYCVLHYNRLEYPLDLCHTTNLEKEQSPQVAAAPAIALEAYLGAIALEAYALYE